MLGGTKVHTHVTGTHHHHTTHSHGTHTHKTTHHHHKHHGKHKKKVALKAHHDAVLKELLSTHPSPDTRSVFGHSYGSGLNFGHSHGVGSLKLGASPDPDF